MKATFELKTQCLQMAINAGYRDPVSMADSFMGYVLAGTDDDECAPANDIKGVPNDVYQVVDDIARRHGLIADVVFSPVRTAPVVTARDEAIMAIQAKFPQYGLSSLGRIFNRDHSSILASLRRSGAWKPVYNKAA
jgi:hypothetical protein